MIFSSVNRDFFIRVLQWKTLLPSGPDRQGVTSPLPERELGELKRSVAELGAIGRNLNQIARLANQTGRVSGPSVQELHALLRACAALKDHVKNLIIANVASWETGNAEANR